MEARTRFARVSGAALKIAAVASVGVLAMIALAWYVSPRWVDLCSPFNYRDAACAPIDRPRMFGYVAVAVGLFLMTLGPVVTSLYKLFRYGQAWETSRVEPAHVNLPIAVGLLYFFAGLIAVSAT